MVGTNYGRLRELALSFPDVSERTSAGAPSFFIRKSRPFLRYHDNHKGNDRCSVWCPVGQSFQEILVFTYPEACFKPGTSSAGHFRNWIGIYLDTEPPIDWNIVTDIIESAYQFAAPKSLINGLDEDRKHTGD